VNHSDELNELFTALAKAQGQFLKIVKDRTVNVESTRGSYSYRYANLADVIEKCKGPLSANGLLVQHTIEASEGGQILLRTWLGHSSGQYTTSIYPVVPVQATPQGFGSALTYAQRYCYCAIIGVAADDDDDGSIGSQPAVRKTGPRVAEPTRPPTADGPIARTPAVGSTAPPADDGEGCSDGPEVESASPGNTPSCSVCGAVVTQGRAMFCANGKEPVTCSPKTGCKK
jgi:hypothetical protein